MSFEGATQWATNPIGKAMDQTGLGKYKPKINIFGQSIDGTALLNPTGLGIISEGAKVAKKVETDRLTAKAKDEFNDNVSADNQAFDKFKSQEKNLLSDKSMSTELFIPKYKTGKNAKETQALAQIFQARKNEALARKAQPGVAQTRGNF